MSCAAQRPWRLKPRWGPSPSPALSTAHSTSYTWWANLQQRWSRMQGEMVIPELHDLTYGSVLASVRWSTCTLSFDHEKVAHEIPQLFFLPYHAFCFLSSLCMFPFVFFFAHSMAASLPSGCFYAILGPSRHFLQPQVLTLNTTSSPFSHLIVKCQPSH